MRSSRLRLTGSLPASNQQGAHRGCRLAGWLLRTQSPGPGPRSRSAAPAGPCPQSAPPAAARKSRSGGVGWEGGRSERVGVGGVCGQAGRRAGELRHRGENGGQEAAAASGLAAAAGSAAAAAAATVKHRSTSQPAHYHARATIGRRRHGRSQQRLTMAARLLSRSAFSTKPNLEGGTDGWTGGSVTPCGRGAGEGEPCSTRWADNDCCRSLASAAAASTARCSCSAVQHQARLPTPHLQPHLRRLDGCVGADRQRRAGGRCPAGRRGAAAARGGGSVGDVSGMWTGRGARRRQGLVGEAWRSAGRPPGQAAPLQAAAAAGEGCCGHDEAL